MIGLNDYQGGCMDQKQTDFKSTLKDYMLKHNLKAGDDFFESANVRNIRTRKANEI